MKAGLPALLLLLAAQAGAQSFVSMGRLFTTPGERAQLDAQRSQALMAGTGNVGGTGAAGVPGVPAAAGVPGMPGGAAALPGADQMATAGAAAGAPGAAAEGAGVETPPGLRLDGIIRRSNGRDVMIVNGEVQPARGASRGSVRLQAEGRSITLKPGQRYDPATGEIHEAAR